MTLGTRTLLVNPPLIGGIAFTRQGRCQEREEVLGTTKPPYTLALVAAMLRDRGCEVRLADLTATRQSVEDLIARLDREHFQPTLIIFPSAVPTIDADVVEMAKQYCEDTKYFLEKKDYVTAFGCINYAHGLIDAYRKKWRE